MSSLFNINYQNYQLNYRLSSSVVILAGGIMVRPYPTPEFSLWIKFSVRLSGSTLLFHGSVALGSTGTFTLAASMISDGGWNEPFGVRGVVVYGVYASIGFSAATFIDSIGLGFNMVLSDDISLIFSGAFSISNPANCYLFASISSVSKKDLALGDFLKAINTITGGHIPVPSWLPSSKFLSLRSATISFATGSGTDPLGRKYTPGFSVSATCTLFGVAVQFSLGSTLTELYPGGPMLPDFTFSFLADFSYFNEMAMKWLTDILKTFIPSEWLEWTHLSLCDIICVKYFSVTGASLLNMAQGIFPTFKLAISIAGITISVSATLNLQHFSLSDVSFWAGIQRTFKNPPSFCKTDSNCGGSTPICDQFSGYVCVASCKTGYVRASSGCKLAPTTTLVPS